MDWWTAVRLSLGTFLDQHGLLAAFAFLLIEEAGLPVPVPGDFLMLILGVRARDGSVNLLAAIAVLELATVIGSTFLYAVSWWGGHGLIYRYGRFMRLSPERLESMRGWIVRRGFLAVFLGRLVPGLRILTAVACGVFRVPPHQFFPAMAVGALVYISGYAAAGYIFGPRVLSAVEGLHLPVSLLMSLLVLAVISIWVLRARAGALGFSNSPTGADRDRRMRAGALAGGVGTLVCTLGMNVLLNVAGNVAFHAPGTIVEQTAARLAYALAVELQPLVLFVAVPAYLAVGVLWGAVYGVFFHPRLRGPDALRGVVFALLPLAFALAVILPALGLDLRSTGAAIPIAAVGELLRHAMYGVTLGLAYPVFGPRARASAGSSARPELSPALEPTGPLIQVPEERAASVARPGSGT